MKRLVQPVRGMHDVLPGQAATWEWLERKVKDVFGQYGYGQVRTPVLEREELFMHPVGEGTDIVQKELFRQVADDGTVYCMRPEGTVATMRALAQADALTRSARVWYMGPMFRHERPQKGRLRQFHQFGAEILGIEEPAADAEMLALGARLWRELGIAAQVELQVNNLGMPAEREAFRASLRDHLLANEAALGVTDRERARTNPLRVLDSKDPAITTILAEAPVLAGHLGSSSHAHHAAVLDALTQAGIDHVPNPRLVRGLDYYNLTVYEWVVKGADRRQDTIAGGGRYDGLLEKIGGGPCPGTGMAAGMERIIDLLDPAAVAADVPDVFLAAARGATPAQGLLPLAEAVRDAGLTVIAHQREVRIRDLFRLADASGARYAVAIGPQEAQAGAAIVKPLRADGAQRTIAQADLPQELTTILNQG